MFCKFFVLMSRTWDIEVERVKDDDIDNINDDVVDNNERSVMNILIAYGNI